MEINDMSIFFSFPL